MFTESKIKSIKTIGIQTVCDITVKDNHSYVANGIVNHNSSQDPNLQNIPRDCINYNTLLLTNKGYLKIGELVPEEEGNYINTEPLLVKTDKGNWKQITNLINKGKKEMFEVEMEDGSIICCTKGHYIKTLEKGFQPLSIIIEENLTILKDEN